MAKGEKAFDAAAAEAAKQTLIANAADIAANFTNNTRTRNKAKPEVWTSWDDFAARAAALGTAAEALDATSLDGIKAGMGAIGGACKDCHTMYKAS